MVDKEKNLNLYLTKLEQVGVSTTNLTDSFKEKLKNGSFVTQDDHGQAHDGSLLDVVLWILTPYAIKLNDLLPESIRVDRNKLIKVCLLHHISKAVKLIANDNQWEVQKLKRMYKYDDSLPSIRTGLHSAVIASQEFGVQWTAEEIEAMTVNDRELTDDQARFHSSIFSNIVRMANELSYMQINSL